MTRGRLVLTAAGATTAAVLAWAGTTLPPARTVLADPALATSPARPAVRGIFHVHTTHSDGTGSPDAVAAAAARVGHQFVIATDHGGGTRPPDPPSYRHGVLYLDGVEVSTASGHYAVAGMGQSPYRLGGEARDVVEDVRRLGGFGVIAHPTSPRERLSWRDWTIDPDGIEWLNVDSEWRDESIAHLALSGLHYLFRRPETVASVFDRPLDALKHWDVLLRRRRVTGLIASDAHARLGLRGDDDGYTGRLYLSLPSYEAVFGALALNVQLSRPLGGDAAVDAADLVAALRAGHAFSSIEGVAGPARFEFCAETSAARACQGDWLPAGNPVRLRADVSPVSGLSMVLLKNGGIEREVAGAVLDHVVPGDAAVYRVEVRVPRSPGRPPVPWVVSNPIYVGPPLDTSVPPARPEAAAAQGLSVDPATWRVECDPTSEGAVAAPANGLDRLDFRFSLGGGRRRGQFVALAHTITPPVEFDRVSFRASANRPMRVSVQLRRPDGQSGLRWLRSVYLDHAPRDVTVFFADMRPVSLAGTLDSSAVDTLLIVVETTNTLPGTAGTVHLAGLRWERSGSARDQAASLQHATRPAGAPRAKAPRQSTRGPGHPMSAP